jgi:hypothetical protein
VDRRGPGFPGAVVVNLSQFGPWPRFSKRTVPLRNSTGTLFGTAIWRGLFFFFLFFIKTLEKKNGTEARPKSTLFRLFR